VSWTASRRRSENARAIANGGSWVASISAKQKSVARASHGWPAIAGSCLAASWAVATTIDVICKEGAVGSAFAQNGAHAAGSGTASANGRPPPGRVTESSQSHSAGPCGVVSGPASAIASSACSAPPGWLVLERRSGSRPQP
jgi:hypothetical protein